MGVVIEAFEKIRGILPGFFQFDKNGFFIQSELSINEDELCIYNDNEPSEVVDNNLKYYIKERISFREVRYLLLQKIKNKELKKLGRVAIVFNEKKRNPLIFYYFVKDKSSEKKMVKLCKESRLKIKKASVKFDLEKGRAIT